MALVTRVLGDCPSCGRKDSYGNVSVRGDHVLRGCGNCRFFLQVPLPPIRKQVIYLDQFFFSGAFRGGDRRFVEASERVKHLAQLQLLVAPYSSVHEDETHQWRGYGDKSHDQLMKFIKATSRGIEFQPAYKVERTQITKALQAFLADEASDYVVEEREGIKGNIHEWEDYYRIEVGGYIGNIELMRKLKDEAVLELVHVFDSWQKSTNTFEDDLALEMADAGKYYMQTYLEMVMRIGKGDYAAVFDSPIMSAVVQSMMYCMPDEWPSDEKLSKCQEFFRSGHFSKAPYHWLSCRMFSTLKDMVKRGAYADREAALKRLSGVFYDVKHIATYAPYCDAFVVDQPMADLVSKPTVALEQRYGTRVFSLNNWDKLFAWFDSIEASMGEGHKAGLAEVYPA